MSSPRVRLGRLAAGPGPDTVARAPARGDLLERAAEEPAGERAPRDDAEPERAARGEHLELHRPRREVVEALLGDEPEEVARRGRGLRARDVPAREVAAADVHDLALRDELLHRLPDLVPGRVPVDVVHLVEIDAIGAQAAEALVARAPDVVRGEPAVVRPFAHLRVDLGREDDSVPSRRVLREPAPDDLLRDALAGLPAVDVGRVEEVDAGVERAIHDREAVGLARERPEVHRAEAEAAHAQTGTAETDVVHDVVLSRRPIDDEPRAEIVGTAEAEPGVRLRRARRRRVPALPVLGHLHDEPAR